jgi:cob(I)alamin adenosyltransferase
LVFVVVQAFDFGLDGLNNFWGGLMDQGYVHVYTGNGKGKTTAAFGLAVRSACFGKEVYIGQFVKDKAYNETKISDFMPNITIEQLGQGCFMMNPPTEQDKICAQKALYKCAEILKSGTYDLVVLDEVFIALYFGLIETESLMIAIQSRAEGVEVVLTGRYAPSSMIDMADLVTEMKEVKHYFAKGVLSREGIDC